MIPPAYVLQGLQTKRWYQPKLPSGEEYISKGKAASAY